MTLHSLVFHMRLLVKLTIVFPPSNFLWEALKTWTALKCGSRLIEKKLSHESMMHEQAQP